MGLTHNIKPFRRIMKISLSDPYIWPNSSKKVFENIFTKLFILHTDIFSVNAVSLLPRVF